MNPKRKRRRINTVSEKDLQNPLIYYIKGSLDGDGTRTKGGFRLSVKDYDFAMYLYKICNKVFSFNVRFHYYHSDGRYKVDIYSADFKEKYDSLIPTSQEEKIQYLMGMFDAEGSFCISNDKHRRLSITSGDVPLLMQLQSYLDKLNIRSQYHSAKKKRNCLMISDWNSQIKYMECIGFRIGRKITQWELILQIRSERKMWHHHGIPREIKESIIRNYKTSFLSIAEMASVYNMPRGSIRGILNRAGIKTNTIPFFKRKKTPKYLYDKLFHMNIVQKKSIKEIAHETGILYDNVKSRLSVCGVI